MATFKEMKSGKSGVPSAEEHEKQEQHECSIHNFFIRNLSFQEMSLKTWTWVPIHEDFMETNTKT